MSTKACLSMKVRVRAVVVATIVAVMVFGVAATPAMASQRGRHLPHHKPKTVKVIREVGAQYNLAEADIQALVVLAYRESSWNRKCVTGSYRGLFQVRTRSKKWSDPAWNTARAIRDIRGVYRTPRAALAHSYSHGWY